MRGDCTRHDGSFHISCFRRRAWQQLLPRSQTAHPAGRTQVPTTAEGQRPRLSAISTYASTMSAFLAVNAAAGTCLDQCCNLRAVGVGHLPQQVAGSPSAHPDTPPSFCIHPPWSQASPVLKWNISPASSHQTVPSEAAQLAAAFCQIQFQASGLPYSAQAPSGHQPALARHLDLPWASTTSCSS